MKPIRLLTLLLILFLFFMPRISLAHDTDIYAASGQGVQPNILIIFDNSISMGNDTPVPCQPVATKVYQKVPSHSDPSGYYWGEYANSVNDLGSNFCAATKTLLVNSGYANNQYTNSRCNRNRMTLATGAWINANDPQNAEVSCSKIDVAKKVITDFVASINDVRVGLMVFNSSSCEKTAAGVCIPRTSGEYEGGKIASKIDSIANNRSALTTAVNGLTAETYTPLAETLYEAGLYFKGQHLFDPNTYENPVQYSCQKNYVILITDGMSTMDHNAVLNTLPNNGDYDYKGEDPGSYGSGGTDYLNDVAKYIYDNQGISVYTIGFTVNLDILQRTAQEANGHYYTADNAQQLKSAFSNVIDEILSKSTSFVAPIVPVSRMERTESGDKLYMAFFKPKLNKMWSGNLKKYTVAQTNGSGYVLGDILDRNNLKAIDDANGQFYSGSISFWNTDQDGGEVEEGGAGQLLKNMELDDRKIYTFFESAARTNLTDTANQFTTTNALITTAADKLNLAAGSKDDLINFVYGYDAYQDESTDVTATRSWILGSFLHSRPVYVDYGNQAVIFAGSNDGMLHAFNNEDGKELWAFIPPDLLPNLQYLHSDYNTAFVDGSPKAYVSYVYNTDGSINSATKAILIFGERRGGNRYYALDVTNPSSPQFLWYISGPTATSVSKRVYQTAANTIATVTSEYEELGESWSTPVIAKVACSGGSNCVSGMRWAAFIGGGYDAANQDKGSGTTADPYTTVTDTIGRAVYVIDIFDGSLVKSFSNAEMTYSIPGDVTIIDMDGNGTIDQLYAGDMGGRVWRFDLDNVSPANWTAKIVFKSNPDGATTNLRKIFYPPDVTLERDTSDYKMIFFGTGDREHPNDKTIVNRLYAVKDRNANTAPGDGNLIDVTADELQTTTDAERRSEILGDLKLGSGWKIELSTHAGEKCLASPLLFYGVVYYTTFEPSGENTTTDPCFVGEGTARLYNVGYKTGAAIFNLNTGNDELVNNKTVAKYDASDRSKVIGTAIPSGVIITVIGGKVTGYAGMGGGVIKAKFSATNPLRPYNWKIEF